MVYWNNLSILLTIFSPLSSAKPGRVVGPVLPYENGRTINTLYDPRIYYQNSLPQANSPHCFLRAQHTNSESNVSQTQKVFSQGKHHQLPSQPCSNLAARPVNDLNANPYHHQAKKIDRFEHSITIDAKLLQAQSQFGAVGVAAVAVVAHRHSGAIQYGFS